MKTNYSLHHTWIVYFFFLVMVSKLLAQNDTSGTFTITPKDVINSANNSASIKEHGIAGAYLEWEGFADRWDVEHKRLIEQLIEIFNNKESPALDRSAAAYYLAEMRSSVAADAFAKNITLQFNVVFPVHNLDGHTMKWGGYVAMQGIIKIGAQSIPALSRNLSESDDAKVRELSLKALYQIEGDKDIVQLRLQKVLKAEKDSQKQARLQSALKAIPATQ